MSEATPAREWRFYIDDMIGFCERVLSFTSGINRTHFLSEPMRFDATVRNIELIGEAAAHVPEEVRSSYPAIPWRMVIATRNRLIHGYLGMDNDTLWSIVTTDIPSLVAALRDLKAGLQR
jgi:uncharacterized protein with HEPN domain